MRYSLNQPLSLNFLVFVFCIFIFSPFLLKPQSVFINQAGYKNAGYKFFYTNSEDSNFALCRSDNGDTVFQGILSEADNDAATGLLLSKGDFSDFAAEGKYYIKTSGNVISDSFAISPDVYEDVLFKSLKAFYYWRCGTALTSQYAGIYSHTICHTNDGIYHSTSGKTGSKSAAGGWHDAGDYGNLCGNSFNGL